MNSPHNQVGEPLERRLVLLGRPDARVLAGIGRLIQPFRLGGFSTAATVRSGNTHLVLRADGVAEVGVTAQRIDGTGLAEPVRSGDGYLVCLDVSTLSQPSGADELAPVLIQLRQALADRPGRVPVAFALQTDRRGHTDATRAATRLLEPFLRGAAGDERVAAFAVALPSSTVDPTQPGPDRVGLLFAVRTWLAGAAPSVPRARAAVQRQAHRAGLVERLDRILETFTGADSSRTG